MLRKRSIRFLSFNTILTEKLNEKEKTNVLTLMVVDTEGTQHLSML